MAQRLMGRMLAGGVMVGAIMSATGPALATGDDDRPPADPASCLVEYTDAEGRTTGAGWVPQGTVIGPFHCRAGRWRISLSPFGPLVSGSADSIRVGERGVVRDAILDVDTREGELAVRELQSIVEQVFGEAAEPVGRALVVTTERAELTAEEITALLEGREVEGVRLLGALETTPETTLNDLDESTEAVSAKKFAFRIGNWLFRGTYTCTTRKDGSKICKIKGTYSKV